MLASLAVLMFLQGCVEDVSTGKTIATVSDPTPVAAPPTNAPAAAQGTHWNVDPAASEIHALGAKVTKTETVKFSRFSGDIQVADNKVSGLTFTVDVTSLDTGNPKLNHHLMSPDFFDAEQFPSATFQSTSITAGAAEAGMTDTVTGNLTMRGTTKTVTFPMKLAVTDDKATGAAEFAINRLDWGIAYPGKPDDLVQEKVVLTVDFTAPNAGAATASAM